MEKITKAQLEAWRAKGYSYQDISKAAGVSMSTVRNYMVRYGMVGAHFVTEEEKEIFYQLRQQGMSTAEIGKATGRSESAVYNALRAAGMIKEVPEEKKEDIFEPQVILYAEKRKPKSKRIVVRGKVWWDDSEFWIPH